MKPQFSCNTNPLRSGMNTSRRGQPVSTLSSYPYFFDSSYFWITFYFIWCSYTIASRSLCKDHKRLVHLARLVLKDGGEGVILRKPKSMYERGRSSFLFKLKVLTSHINIFVPSFNDINRHREVTERRCCWAEILMVQLHYSCMLFALSSICSPLFHTSSNKLLLMK